MFFHVGIVIAAYAGVRAFEAISQNLPSIGRRNGAKAISPVVKACKPEVDKTLARAEQQYIHNANASMLSTGLLVTRKLFPAAGALGFASYVYSIVPEIRRAERRVLQDRQVSTDLAFVSLNMMTLGFGWYATTAFSLWMMYKGKAAHVSARRGLHKGASHFFSENTDTVWVLKNAVELEIPSDEVKVNDLIVVSQGVRIPFDGVLREGKLKVNQYILTGELQPIEKGLNARVYANTVVASGRAVIRVINSQTLIS